MRSFGALISNFSNWLNNLPNLLKMTNIPVNSAFVAENYFFDSQILKSGKFLINNFKLKELAKKVQSKIQFQINRLSGLRSTIY